MSPKQEVQPTWENKNSLSLDRALKAGIPTNKCSVYKLSVGGSEYIGFTTQDPVKRLKQHLDSAGNDSKLKVHVELRRFGYLHDFEVISEHENEVLGLVAEISSIKKYQPALNTSIGGEGNDFDVFEGKNHLGELVFFVQNKLVDQSDNTPRKEKYDLNSYKDYLNKIKESYEKFRDVEHRFDDKFMTVVGGNSGQGQSTHFFVKSKKESIYAAWEPARTVSETFGFNHDTPEVHLVFDFPAHVEEELEEYFYDFDREVELLWDRDDVESYISKRIKMRKHLHELYLDWLDNNDEFFSFLIQNNITLNKYKYSLNKGLDNADRVFTFNGFNPKLPFKNLDAAQAYLVNTAWFKEGTKKSFFTSKDAIYPVPIKGFFKSNDEKINCSQILPRNYVEKEKATKKICDN